MIERHQRSRILGGALVAALVWDIAPTWPRVVIPDDPAQYRLDFAKGLDWLVLSRPGHSPKHITAVADALRDAGANVVVSVTLPDYWGEE